MDFSSRGQGKQREVVGRACRLIWVWGKPGCSQARALGSLCGEVSFCKELGKVPRERREKTKTGRLAETAHCYQDPPSLV